MGLMLLTARPTDIIDSLQNAGVDVAIVLCSWFSTDIGGGRDNSLLEAVTQLLGERLVGDTDTHTTILGNQIRGQIDGTVKNQCGRFHVTFFQTVDELPSHIGHLAEVTLHTGIAVDEADKGLRVVTLLRNRCPIRYP